ncbi:MAG: hypothetical protein VB095_06135 [Anaerovorax sp.]|nr:hypothetical protein [Anaerovorax sp.]
MNRNTIEGDLIEVSLRQLGATKVKEICSVMYFVEFELTDTLTISYIYNITHKEKYYLQRVKPYPIPQGKFADEREIVDYITKDVNKFRNATRSSNFQTFLGVTEKVCTITDRMEELFLNHNVHGDDLTLLNDQLDALISGMDTVRRAAKEL